MSQNPNIFSEDFLHLLNSLQTEIYNVVSRCETREQAIEIKNRLLRPFGSLNSKFDLSSNQKTKTNYNKLLTKQTG